MVKLVFALPFLVLPLTVAAQSVHDHAKVPADWPPNAVFDLTVDTVSYPPSDSTLTLTWSAPSDTPGMIQIVVPAAAYDLRYSSDGPIEDETAWGQATPCGETVGMVPQDPEKPEMLTVSLPSPGTRYWFAIKSQDNLTGLWSEISTPPSAEGKTTGTMVSPSPSPSPSPDPGGNGGGGNGGDANSNSCGHVASGHLALIALAAALLIRGR